MKVMIYEEEFYPVYQIETHPIDECICGHHEVELSEEELKQYHEAMSAYYDVQSMLAEKWEARHEELMTLKYGRKDANGKRWTLHKAT